MLDYISVQLAADKWGISERRIQKLCQENRVSVAVRFGHAWAIPKDAEKPIDARSKKLDKCVNNLEGGNENGKHNSNC